MKEKGLDTESAKILEPEERKKSKYKEITEYHQTFAPEKEILMRREYADRQNDEDGFQKIKSKEIKRPYYNKFDDLKKREGKKEEMKIEKTDKKIYSLGKDHEKLGKNEKVEFKQKTKLDFKMVNWIIKFKKSGGLKEIFQKRK